MKDQPKTPGAMVLAACPFCGSDPMHYDNGYATCPKYRCPMNGLVVKNEDWNTRPAPAEQTPAVGGSIAERIRAATIADSGQDGVNIVEGRFGRAMAALCLQLDGETPAVGGDDDVIAELKMMADMADNNEDPDDHLMYMRWLARIRSADAKVAPLLAEIEQLKTSREAAHKVMARQRSHIEGYIAEIAEALDDETLTSIAQVATSIRDLQARIAELEAQQGEPVAVIDEGDDGLFAEFIYGEDGSPLRRGDKLYLNPADKGYVSKLAYQSMQAEVERLSAQPATAKVVLPERMEVYSAVDTGWNACLDEIAKLNPLSP